MQPLMHDQPILQIIKHRVVTKTYRVFGSTRNRRHELEVFASCAVLAHVAIFNIMRNPNRSPRRRRKQREKSALRGRARTTLAVQSSVRWSRGRARYAGG